MGGGLRLEMDLGTVADGAREGDSIAVAGVCLTVVEPRKERVYFELSRETLEKTHLGKVRVGEHLNLEASLKVGDRLGGHWVSGHVDGLGKVLAVEEQDEFALHTYEPPAEVRPLIVPKGSITVEGVSLTVASVLPDSAFTVALIPETLERTTLSLLQVGDPLHMEGDMIGKHVQRYLEAYGKL